MHIMHNLILISILGTEEPILNNTLSLLSLVPVTELADNNTNTLLLLSVELTNNIIASFLLLLIHYLI